MPKIYEKKELTQLSRRPKFGVLTLSPLYRGRVLIESTTSGLLFLHDWQIIGRYRRENNTEGTYAIWGVEKRSIPESGPWITAAMIYDQLPPERIEVTLAMISQHLRKYTGEKAQVTSEIQPELITREKMEFEQAKTIHFVFTNALLFGVTGFKK